MWVQALPPCACNDIRYEPGRTRPDRNVRSKSPSCCLSFGWHRVEILGVLMSVLLIWVVTGVLIWEAIQRLIHPEQVDGKQSAITKNRMRAERTRISPARRWGIVFYLI